MLRVGRYVFKRAETEEEFEEVHRLNYRTFVREIHQHADPGDGRLVDKFHDKNVYFIALREGRVVGMISAHDRPPFSITPRLPDPGLLEQPGTRPMEVRLLAVEPGERNGTVFAGLLWSLYLYTRESGHTDLFISGVAERVPLYERLGFRALGPAVACGGASFVPMGVPLSGLVARLRRSIELWTKHLRRHAGDRPAIVTLPGLPDEPATGLRWFLPGPVPTAPAVREAFQRPPIYHRGPEFIALFETVRRALGQLVAGRDVALFNGSGTLANEVVAVTLAAAPSPGRGLLLVNGEFGQRLARQAERFGLRPRVLTWRWGRAWDLDEVEAALAEEPPGSWVWGVHLESSTGVLNDLPGLVRRARERDIRVCADCISSLGAVPLDLRDVYLASGASGKSLGAYAGVAIVFAAPGRFCRLDTSRVPSCLDLAAALATEGPRYTFPSPLLRAVDAALASYGTPEGATARYRHYRELGRYVRERLRGLGIEPLADEEHACPVITTVAPPALEPAEAFVRRCQDAGFAVGGQSGYLAERRLVQIATMGAVTREDCTALFQHLERSLAPCSTLTVA
jgi:aspartate aminotransferase-like enzyme